MTKSLIEKKIEWKSEYNINEITIDKEHKELFDLAQKALKINTLENFTQEKEELKKVISELLLYTKTHFTNEEIYMKKIYYPDLDNHILLHKTMIKSLTLLVKQLNTLSMIEIETKLYTFIEEYFLKHIITEDKKIHLWITPLSNLKHNFGWKDVYSVNNHHIDKEHKELFDIAKQAFEIVESPKRIEKIKDTIKKLYTYMKEHFKNEEEYMQKITYPKYEEHKLLHEEIINHFNSFIKKLPSMHIDIFEKELAKLIDISLLQHIIQEDRQIINWEKDSNI